MRRLVLLLALITLLVSACGSQTGTQGEKIAVLRWDEALEKHPRAAELKKLKQEFDELKLQRQQTARRGRDQLGALARLQELKQRTQQNFMTADLQTRMAERQALEQEKLKAFYDAEVERVRAATAEDEQALEEKFRLEMFNLRLKLDTIHLKPDERQTLESRLSELQEEREHARMELRALRAKMVAEKLAPERDKILRELDAYAKKLHTERQRELDAKSKSDAENFKRGPESLSRLLTSLDAKLDEKQQAIASMENGMRVDMESVVTKLARERKYSVVLHKFRVNVNADDITQDVLQELNKLQK